MTHRGPSSRRAAYHKVALAMLVERSPRTTQEMADALGLDYQPMYNSLHWAAGQGLCERAPGARKPIQWQITQAGEVAARAVDLDDGHQVAMLLGSLSEDNGELARAAGEGLHVDRLEEDIVRVRVGALPILCARREPRTSTMAPFWAHDDMPARVLRRTFADEHELLQAALDGLNWHLTRMGRAPLEAAC